MNFEAIQQQADLLSQASQVFKTIEIQGFLEAVCESELLKGCDVDIDISANCLIIKTNSDLAARDLWRHRFLLASYAARIVSSLEIAGDKDKYQFALNTMTKKADLIITPSQEGDLIKRIDDCDRSCAISTWFDKCLHPNSRIILWPDRPTTPEETIAFFGYNLKGNWHPEDRLEVYRDSKQEGIIRDRRYRAKFSNGQWAWWTADVEFAIYRGFECRICTVKEVEPIEGLAWV